MKRRSPPPIRVVQLVLATVLLLGDRPALAARSPRAAAGKPTPAEAVAAAFGASTRLNARGYFSWIVPRNPFDPSLSGQTVLVSVKDLRALPTADGTSRWLLVTQGATVNDDTVYNCHGCGALVSAFVLARGAGGALIRGAAAPVMTWGGSWGEAPEVSIVASGPARWALRLEDRQVGQGETDIIQSFYAIAPGFPELLSLGVHYDIDGACIGGPRERARERALYGYEPLACSTTHTTLRFVPARPGETDDPGQWVVRATTRGDIRHATLPLGVVRLPFKGGKYQKPARIAGR